MNWIILLYFIELGYSPFYDSRNVMDDSNTRIRTENTYYITLDTEVVILDHLFIGGAIKTYIHSTDNYDYFPFEADYLFKAGIRFNNLELGFRHFCLHPVRPYEMYYQPQGSTDGAYEEFYIRISSEF